MGLAGEGAVRCTYVSVLFVIAAFSLLLLVIMLVIQAVGIIGVASQLYLQLLIERGMDNICAKFTINSTIMAPLLLES